MNKNYYYKMYKAYVFCLMIGVLCMFILTACTTQYMCKDGYYCSINKFDNLKYFNYHNKNLSVLKMPKNLNITFFSKPSLDYYIPLIDLSGCSDYKNNVNVNICPPVVFENTLDESCLRNVN